jgi:hypothetical protein
MFVNKDIFDDEEKSDDEDTRVRTKGRTMVMQGPPLTKGALPPPKSKPAGSGGSSGRDMLSRSSSVSSERGVASPDRLSEPRKSSLDAPIYGYSLSVETESQISSNADLLEKQRTLAASKRAARLSSSMTPIKSSDFGSPTAAATGLSSPLIRSSPGFGSPLGNVSSPLASSAASYSNSASEGIKQLISERRASTSSMNSSTPGGNPPPPPPPPAGTGGSRGRSSISNSKVT